MEDIKELIKKQRKKKRKILNFFINWDFVDVLKILKKSDGKFEGKYI